MVDARELSHLIGTIYDAVLKPDRWRDALASLCHQLSARAGSVHVVNPIEGHASLLVEHGTDPAWTALLLSKYAGMSPIGAAVLIAEVDQPIGAFDFVDEQEFVESRFYKEWCGPQGYHDMLGALIAKKPRQVGAVSVTRGLDKGRFGSSEREFVGLVAPHVRRAVTLSGLLEQQAKDRAAIAGVIDKLSCAVIVLDRKGKIIRNNTAGDVLCAANIIVGSTNGFVRMAEEAASATLKSLITAASQEPGFIVSTGRDGEKYLAVLMTLDASADTFALFVHRPEPDIPAIGKALTATFALTPREVSVLLPMLEGKPIEAIADGLGIGLATARTHLNNLFAKTGTNRQVDLVQKVISLIPPVRLSG